MCKACNDSGVVVANSGTMASFTPCGCRPVKTEAELRAELEPVFNKLNQILRPGMTA